MPRCGRSGGFLSPTAVYEGDRQALHWAEWEDARLRRMAAEGRTKREIAAALGRSPNAVMARAIAIRVRLVAHARVTLHGIGYRPEEVVRKVCLRCRRPFDARSRIIFVCDPCHASDDWRMGTAAL